MNFKFVNYNYDKETKMMSGTLEWELNGELKKTNMEYSMANIVSEDGSILEGKSMGDAIIASLIDRSNKLNEIQYKKI